jgi:Lipocalin-like domain
MIRLFVSATLASALFSSVAAPDAAAQTARDLVGTWKLVSAAAQQGGTKTDMFGPDPSGTLVFGSDGHYALIFLRRDLPKVASDSRTSATPDESRAIAQGSIAHFGTYTVDETGEVLVLRIEGSTFPNWDGAEQRRAFSLSGDELTYTSPGSTGVATQVTMRRVK